MNIEYKMYAIECSSENGFQETATFHMKPTKDLDRRLIINGVHQPWNTDVTVKADDRIELEIRVRIDPIYSSV